MSKNVFLVERGFGRASYGKATVIAGPEGEELTLREEIMPDGKTGGSLTVVPLLELKPFAAANVNTNDTVYEITVERNSGPLLTNGSIQIKEIDAENMSVKMFSCKFIYRENQCLRFVNFQSEISQTAKELAEGILYNAIVAALNRSFDSAPSKLYYGNAAPVKEAPVQKKWFNKETGVMQDTKPVYSEEFLLRTKKVKVLV